MSGTVYFQLMSAGNLLATVSVRRVPISRTWAYEVRYVDKVPQRGTIIAAPDTEELQLVHSVLQDYFATYSHDTVSS
jgi:hypothetical protein